MATTRTTLHFSEKPNLSKVLTLELHASICPLFPSVHPCVLRLVQTDALGYLYDTCARTLRTCFSLPLFWRASVQVCVRARLRDPREHERVSG